MVLWDMTIYSLRVQANKGEFSKNKKFTLEQAMKPNHGGVDV
jgi:hypothetical protein